MAEDDERPVGEKLDSLSDYIRACLVKLRSQIESVGHGASLGFWVGQAAAERQQADDWASGRAMWESAWRRTKSGIAKLDDGRLDEAIILLVEAQSLALDALGARLRPDDLLQLGKPAKPRGRPRGKKKAPDAKK